MSEQELRDYFAGQALAGELANPCEHDVDDANMPRYMAELAYKVANAMIEERRKWNITH